MPHLQYLLGGGKVTDPEYQRLQAQHDGGGGTRTTTATAPRISRVDTFADLKSVLPTYTELSFTEILTRISKMGVSLTSPFYKELQQGLIDLERASGVPVSQIANTRRLFSAVQKAVEQGIPAATGDTAATGRTQFASEAALDVAQAERLRAQTEIERQQLQATIAATEQRIREIEIQEQAATQRQREALAAEREMLQLRLDNDRRTLVYSEIGATTRTLIQEKGAERGRQVGLAGKDVFRFAASLRGRGVTGPTPMDIFKQQGAEFLQAPLPQASMEMPVPQLEGILAGMRGLRAPVAAGFGFAKGGVIDMERGGDGVFSMARLGLKSSPWATARLR